MITYSRVKRGFTIAALLLSQSLFAQRIITLDEARQLALSRNAKLKIAQQEIEGAKAQKAQAYASDKPKVDASVMALHVGRPLSAMLPPLLGGPSVSIAQPIYVGGKIRMGKEAAQLGVDISEEQKVLRMSEVIFNTEKAYWSVVAVSEKVGLTKQYIKLLETLQVDLDNMYTAGLTYKNDLLKVKVQLNEAQLNLIKVQDGLVMAKLALAQTMGMPNEVGFSVSDSVSGTFESRLVRSDSVTNGNSRSELKMMRKAIEIHKLQEKMLKADHKPVVALSVGGFSNVGKQINFENGKNMMTSYFGVLSVSIPIWDWGMNREKVKQQGYKVNAQQLQLQETKELIGLEIQQSYMQLNQSAKRIELSDASLEQANENLRLSNDRFKAGTITGKDVLEAQTIWQQTGSNIIDAKIEYRINEANLRKVLGTQE